MSDRPTYEALKHHLAYVMTVIRSDDATKPEIAAVLAALHDSEFYKLLPRRVRIDLQNLRNSLELDGPK